MFARKISRFRRQLDPGSSPRQKATEMIAGACMTEAYDRLGLRFAPTPAAA